jgi:FkbM family methyltransferase
VPTAKPSQGDSQPNWKERYKGLKARLAEARTAAEQSRAAVERAAAREADLRARLASVAERLHRHERLVLRSEVLAALLPARAAWCRTSPPDLAALDRERQFAQRSPSYSKARDASAPVGAERVEIGGLGWWVPRDERREGRLADRIVGRKWLPLEDILRTREAIANGVMLDVGANIGLTSVTRVVAGDTDVVYAAEPAPDNYACLVRNAIDNGLAGVVLPDRVAISDEDGVGRLRLSGSIGGHLLSESGEFEVPIRRLDSWVAGLDVPVERVRYVKVDTQGREWHVLAGAPALRARSGVVWELEFSPRHLRSAGRSAAELIALMQASFTHFVDLTPEAPGRRLRRVAELGDALAYLESSYTNLITYRSSAE